MRKTDIVMFTRYQVIFWSKALKLQTEAWVWSSGTPFLVFYI